jgi:DNA-binding NarL/FixJ family response regulator
MQISTDKSFLLVDDDKSYRKTLASRLRDEGYNHVIEAASPEEALHQVKTHKIDLAIIDIRLRDNTDSNDRSGLTLAAQLEQTLPKIILTMHPSLEYLRDAYRPRVKERLARDFIGKEEGFAALLLAISRILQELQEEEERNLSKIEPQQPDFGNLLEKYLTEGLTQSRLNHRVRLALIALNCIIVLVGIVGVFLGNWSVSLLTTVSGLAVTTFNGFFTKDFEDNIRETVNQCRKELLELQTQAKKLKDDDDLDKGLQAQAKKSDGDALDKDD